MKHLMLFLALVAIPVGSQPLTPHDKVVKAADGLFPPSHRVLIADEAQWEAMSERLSLDTDNAFTNMQGHLTILRGSFVNTASPVELRHVLAHEAGHVRCDCYDEKTAEFWALAHL